MTSSRADRWIFRLGAIQSILALALTGCAKRELTGRPSDSSAMATMPGMATPPSLSHPGISLTPEQVRHGGVRWAPATGGAANDRAAATLSLATLPGQLAPNEDRTARLGAPSEVDRWLTRQDHRGS